MDLSKLNVVAVWTGVVSTATACLWLFTNIAWAEDVDRIEARLIKQELRQLRDALRHATDPAHIEDIKEDIREAIDDLCDVKPNDRECNQ